MAGVDRPAVTAAPSRQPGPPGGYEGRQAVEAVWRIESARIVGGLARYTGDFALAEDLAQEALAEALVSWPRDGVPRNPAGWLLTVGRRRAIDGFRRRSALDERYAALAADLDDGQATSGAAPDTGEEDFVLYDPERIDDDVLALDLHLLPPGAVARGQRRAHLARARRPDQRRDRAGVRHPDRDRAGPDHPRQEDARRGAGAVRGAAGTTSAASGSARC